MGFLSENDNAAALASLSAFKKIYGFIPRIFREQSARPDLVAAEATLIETLLFQEGTLTRLQKELILLAVSAANGNVYFPAVHAQTLQFLGVKLEQSDVEQLRAKGFSDDQILEAVLMVGLTCLLNTTQFGLGTEPDFKPRLNTSPKEVNPAAVSPRPMLERPLTAESVSDDPDLPSVKKR